MRKPSLAAADAANACMCLLVALYGAMVAVLIKGSAMPLPAFFPLAAALTALCLLLSKKGARLGFSLPKTPDPINRRVFLSAAGLSLLVSLVYLWAFFPGGFSSDTTTQWHQIRGGLPLSDWHPALHTMLLWLVTRVCDHPAFALLVQGACYALAVGYAAATLRRWRVPKAACALVTLYLSASPAISNIMAFPWKDCAFAISALFLSVQLFEIHCSQGEWLKGRLNPFALAVTLALCAILRHNGVALSLAAGVWLLISVPGLRKRALMTALCAAALFALIKGPLYTAAGVQKDATPLDETIGLPLTVLSHIYVEAPEALNAETVAFLETLAPRGTYLEHHRPGDWNETKWFVSQLPEGHGYTLPQVFSFALRAGLKSPDLAIEALGALLKLPMQPVGGAHWRMTPYVDASAEQFGLSKAHQPFLSRALNWLCRMTATPALSWLFWNPGMPLMMIMLFCVLFARHRPLTSLLLPAMLIGYHFATSVMLSSPTDFRFFLPTLMAAPLTVIALCAKPHPTAADSCD